MDPAEVARRLIDLALEAGLEVRPIRAGSGAGSEGDPAAASGVCRVRDAVWVMLSPSDPVEDQISVLVRALADHAPDVLEGRYLPPAVRDRIQAEIGSA